jgi:hypothetical protein
MSNISQEFKERMMKVQDDFLGHMGELTLSDQMEYFSDTLQKWYKGYTEAAAETSSKAEDALKAKAAIDQYISSAKDIIHPPDLARKE